MTINALLHPLKWFEQQALFHPEKAFRGTPEHVDLTYEDVFPLTPDGVQLHGWHIPGPSDVVWLIFHGNGGNISVRLDQYQAIHRRYGASIIVIDYRGYGQSGGEPSESGLHADAMTAYKLACELHPSKKFVVFGRSMGGAVAAQLASVVSPQALILEAAISSLHRVMLERAPWIRFVPLQLLMDSKLETTKYVADSSTPVLIFHGDADETVSYENAELIFEAANDPKHLEIIPSGEHDGLDLVDPDRYHAVLTEFLEKHDAL